MLPGLELLDSPACGPLTNAEVVGRLALAVCGSRHLEHAAAEVGRAELCSALPLDTADVIIYFLSYTDQLCLYLISLLFQYHHVVCLCFGNLFIE